MKMKSKIMTVLTMLLVLSIANAALAEPTTEPEPKTTVATVSFIEGIPEFVDPEDDPDSNLFNMDIDFGEHVLPLGDQNYTAEDNDHTLRIADPRSNGNAGNWKVTAQLSTFTGTGDTTPMEFVGTIKLSSPTFDERLSIGTPLMLASGEDALQIVEAGQGLDKGYYDITWAKNNIALLIDGEEAEEIIEPAAFTADITWTFDAT